MKSRVTGEASRLQSATGHTPFMALDCERELGNLEETHHFH